MEYIVIFAIGFCIGIASCILFLSKSITRGWVNIDNSIPGEDPYIFMEFSNRTELLRICSKKYVLFKVKHKNYISQN